MSLACDTHVHVFADPAHFPMDPNRGYTPGLADIAALKAHLNALDLGRVVIVQPSIYGTDNRATLAAVASLKDCARGIAVVAPDATFPMLYDLDQAGIRGLRLNLAASGGDPRASFRLAPLMAELGWHLQVFAPIATLAELGAELTALPMPVVLDHYAGTRAALPEVETIRRLMGHGAIVKLAAPYLVSDLPDHADCAPLAAALAAENPKGLIWGSNWPHPTASGGRASISPFRTIDDRAGLARLTSWIGAEASQACLIETPARLFGFEGALR